MLVVGCIHFQPCFQGLSSSVPPGVREGGKIRDAGNEVDSLQAYFGGEGEGRRTCLRRWLNI